MCGIAGWMRMGEEKVTHKKFKEMFRNLESRGLDAAGIGYRTDSCYHVLKAPGRAKKLMSATLYRKNIDIILDSPWVLLHTRLATHGSPEFNQNNHPIVNKGGMIVHNGIVYTKENNLAEGETDTEQLMLQIQKYGWEGLTNVYGSMAIAYVDFESEGFYLYARHAPLFLAICNNVLFFGSTPEILGVREAMAASRNMLYYVTEKGIKEIKEIGLERYEYKHRSYQELITVSPGNNQPKLF